MGLLLSILYIPARHNEFDRFTLNIAFCWLWRVTMSAMCNRYTTPEGLDIERLWQVGARNPPRLWQNPVHPKAQAPFIRRATGQQRLARELVVGRWGLIPWFSTTPAPAFATQNARSEELTRKASYKHAWARGQRCIIPAQDFDEPCWESGKNQWWRFRRADGLPWGLAGLWNAWVDRSSGEIVESFTMLTLNADEHALMRRMHKPDPKLDPDLQDKRSVIPINPEDVDAWLGGSLSQAQALLRLAPVELFDAGPI